MIASLAARISSHGQVVQFNMVFVFLVTAIVCFVLACGVVKQWVKSFWIPLGLALTAAALLVEFCF